MLLAISFCHEIHNFLLKEENQKILQYFYMSPHFMENLIAIHEYFQLKKKKKGLPLELSVEVLSFKDKMNKFLSGMESETLLANIGNKLKDLKIEELPFDSGYEVEMFFLETGQYYSLINKASLERIQQSISSLYPEFSLEDKSDIFNEKFRNTELNFLKKVVLSKPFQSIVNESYLKKVFQRALSDNKVEFVKNYVDYPAFADFLVTKTDSKKYAIFVN